MEDYDSLLYQLKQEVNKKKKHNDKKKVELDQLKRYRFVVE